MTWFRADDTFPTHRKVLAIPRRDRAAAVGLWTLAGTWSAGQLTDGHVPAFMLTELASSKRHADLLVTVGLWETADDGYRFHDWLDYNPSAEEVRAEQARRHEAKARAGRAGGIASGVARRKHGRSSDEAELEAESKQPLEATGSETKPRPGPSRPSVSNETGRQRPPLEVVPEGNSSGDTTQTLVAFYVDRHTGKVPSTVRAQIGKGIKGLLAEGFDPDVLRQALTEMVRKSLNPSTLASVVNQFANGDPAQAEVEAIRRHNAEQPWNPIALPDGAR